MCLEKSTEVCKNENAWQKFLVELNEHELITSDVFKNKACKAKPKHATKPLPDCKTSVKENMQIPQVSNYSHSFRDNNEKKISRVN